MTLKQTFLLYSRMARPNQLLAVSLVYAWGALVAAGQLGVLRPRPFLTGLLPLLLISASIHYANEYADHETAALTSRTPFSGGSGALADYGAPPELALRLAWASLIAGLLFSIGWVFWGSLPLVGLALLLVGAAGGWLYSLPPLALAWRGWGEIDNAFLGGLLLPAYGFTVQSETLAAHIFLLALPFGLLVFNNLLATTWADREADEQVGKFTLATRWSARRLRQLYFLVVLLAYALLLIFRGWLIPTPIALASFITLPFTLWASRAYTRQHSPFPSVLVMVLFAILQLMAWSLLVFLEPA